MVAADSAVTASAAESITPRGDRAMGSLFTRLDYDYDNWLNLNAGLRYDRYRLRGETGLNTRRGSESIFPNPYLKPETSTSWEVGFNVLKEDLLFSEDRVGMKVSYFNTRVDDFSYMALGVQPPGYGIANIGTKIQKGPGSRAPVTAMVPDDVANAGQSCSAILGSSEHMPMDRGTATLGARFLERKLDVGVRARYSGGYYVKGGVGVTTSQTGVYPHRPVDPAPGHGKRHRPRLSGAAGRRVGLHPGAWAHVAGHR